MLFLGTCVFASIDCLFLHFSIFGMDAEKTGYTSNNQNQYDYHNNYFHFSPPTLLLAEFGTAWGGLFLGQAFFHPKEMV